MAACFAVMLSPCRAARDLLPIARVGRAPSASPLGARPVAVAGVPHARTLRLQKGAVVYAAAVVFFMAAGLADFRLNCIFTECGVFTYNI